MQIISGNNNNYITTKNDCNVLILEPNILTATFSSATTNIDSEKNDVTFVNDTDNDITVAVYHDIDPSLLLCSAEPGSLYFDINKNSSYSTSLIGTYFYTVYIKNNTYSSYTVEFSDPNNNINSSCTFELIKENLCQNSYATFSLEKNKKYNIKLTLKT